MLDRRIRDIRMIDYMESLGNVYRNMSQTFRPMSKTYRDAQLGEIVHSVAVEHAPEHKIVCGSKLAGEKHGEGETAAE
jgi:hypothetical protein